MADESCAADQLDGFRRLGETHGDRKVVGGGAIPLAPTIYEYSNVQRQSRHQCRRKHPTGHSEVEYALLWLDRRTMGRTLTSNMKSIPISDLRQHVADVIDDVQASDEPTVVLQRSRRAAYIVNPDRYERDQAELSALRRAVFLSETREAEAEYQAGQASTFEDVEQLLDELRG